MLIPIFLEHPVDLLSLSQKPKFIDFVNLFSNKNRLIWDNHQDISPVMILTGFLSVIDNLILGIRKIIGLSINPNMFNHYWHGGFVMKDQYSKQDFYSMGFNSFLLLNAQFWIGWNAFKSTIHGEQLFLASIYLSIYFKLEATTL